MSDAADPPPADLKPDHQPTPEPIGPPLAWQPFTFRGAAAFAQAPGLRLFLMQVVVAALSAATLVWFLGHCYRPVITQAVEELPAAATLTNGQISGFTNTLNSETKFLSIAIAQEDDADLGQAADIQITLRRDHLEISSLVSSALGSFDWPYPKDSVLDLSRGHLEPLWGAWQQVALAGIGVAIFGSLLVCWILLSILYAPAAKFVAWYCDRQLSWLGARRLASAALLPGALVLSLGILLYGWRRVDVFGFAFIAVTHLLVGWIYVLAAPVFTPPLGPVSPNPFQGNTLD